VNLVDLKQLEERVREFVAGPGKSFLVKSDPRLTDRVAMNVVASSVFSEEEELERVELLRNYQRALFDAGLAWISGPLELGGGGLPKDADAYVRRELSCHPFPDNTLVRTGSQVLGPSMLAYGSAEIRQEFLPKVHRGDLLVCQLFSEPDAGSDLANIKTRADRAPGGWVISGQKVWSSGAKFADFGVCIARTEPESKRHSGLSAFFLDMHAPGVEVRIIKQMTGGAEFCEVFFTEVFVPDSFLIGAEGSGWAVVLDILMNERSSIGDELLPPRSYIERLAKSLGNGSNEFHRSRVAGLFERYEVGRLLIMRLQSAAEDKGGPGPELALTKLVVTNLGQEMSAVASELFGPRLVADSGDAAAYAWSEFVLGIPGMRIGGGTDEVLKNGVAERILGLPRS